MLSSCAYVGQPFKKESQLIIKRQILPKIITKYTPTIKSRVFIYFKMHIEISIPYKKFCVRCQENVRFWFHIHVDM